MDTADMLKKAWQAVVASGVPAEVQGEAFKAAIADIRGATPQAPPAAPSGGARAPRKRAAKTTAPGKPANGDSGDGSVLDDVGEADDFFASIAHETGVAEQDLRDVFHVENGAVELKLASKELGGSNKEKTTTIATLLAGALFGGTDHQRLPFPDVHEVCKSKRCYDQANASTYLKALPGFAALGKGKNQDITAKSGWEAEFAKAVERVLGKGDGGD
jgi:hypothetical protein